MRSAQLTTSPSGVVGAGRDQRVVADAVEGLPAQVERRQRHVGAPGGVVEAAVDVGGEGVLAGVAARAVAAVVPEGDGLGQRHVEPAGPGDAGGHLGHLEGVGQPGPLVVVGEDEDLGLAGQPPEGRWRAGCGRGHARSRSATGPAPRPGPGARRPRHGWRPGPAARPRGPRVPARSKPGDRSGRRRWSARLSAWAKVTPRPPWPAMVDAQRRLRSVSPGRAGPGRRPVRGHRGA